MADLTEMNWTELLQDCIIETRSKLSKIRLKSIKVKGSTGRALDQENKKFHLSYSMHSSSF